MTIQWGTIKKVIHIGHGQWNGTVLGLTVFAENYTYNEVSSAVRKCLEPDTLPKKAFFRTYATHLIDDKFIVKVTYFDKNDYAVDIQAID